MNLTSITVRRLTTEMLTPFTTSFGTQTHRDLLIVEARDDAGTVGYGECVAGAEPTYSEEATSTCEVALAEYVLPRLQNAAVEHPDDISTLLHPIKRNNMAKASVEGAVWDLWAKQQGISLSQALGGTKSRVDVGLSIGIKPTDAELLQAVGEAVEAGYRRIKIKIAPGRDLEMMRAVRREFPDEAIMVDANSAYTLDDAQLFAALDELNLMMIEQPLAHDDIVDHRHLQAAIRTPICLDESIHSLDDARKALELGSGKIINIKVGRVGGLTESLKIEQLCRESGVDAWCGGMLETGIGRAHNVAIASLDGFTLPGDTAPSARYWAEDLITPEVTMHNGQIEVPTGPGLGYEVKTAMLESLTTQEFTVQLR
ncbi:o-succinylbenzoate synthase [Nesterenkonia natronophila]|uniref:o-succinylbenzoate synthase n=1 Tax=Nesterenkonia natronophila TaxID=2174932 RepID=A0A3A4F2I5_9MICC|nr:o-succinylbenzoate synthase [Nesterenkonia natronophila]RJN32263.1 o-succinylbenzoate synthase [Nesterenkonia natronophila]